ncbi:hypothetical protein ACLK19_20655 [Escherichia coli]
MWFSHIVMTITGNEVIPPLQVTKYDKPFSQSIVYYIPFTLFYFGNYNFTLSAGKITPVWRRILGQQFGGDATDHHPG